MGKHIGAFCRLLIAFTLLAPLNIHANGSPINLYSYHTDAPFHLPDSTSDLTRAFVNLLNQHFSKSGQPIVFNLVTIERNDLNQIVESGQPYLILWANELWFSKRDSKIRASQPIFYDADVWISSAEKPIDYKQPQDLIAHTMGGRRGYFYKGLNSLVEEGKTVRIDNNSDQDNLRALQNGEIDIFVMSRSSLLYWVAKGFQTESVYVAQSPHDAFTRHILYSHHHSSLSSEINDFIAANRQNSRWEELLKFWGVDNLTTPIELELDELINYPVKK